MSDTERVLAEEVRRRAKGKHLVLLLDFDGTLCAFEADPGAVTLPDSRRDALVKLQSRATIGIVSGRRLADVRDRVALDRIIVAGLHGLEIEGLGERYVHPDLEKSREAVAAVREALRAAAGGIPGAFVEDKEASVALHFREADAAGQRSALEAFAAAADPYLSTARLRLLRGSYVLELLPNIDWNKGHAVAWILERLARDRAPLFTVYIGDDVTDQDAFTVVERDGMAIAASDRVTANVHLDGPVGVERFLHAL